jgi:hypothetical protein
MKTDSPVIGEDSAGIKARGRLNRHWIQTVSLICLLLLVCGIVVSRGFSDRVDKDVFFALTLAGYLAVFLSVRPAWELSGAAGLALALGGLQWIALKRAPRLLPFLALLGLSALVILAIRTIRGKDANPRLLRDALTSPLLLFLLGYLASGPLELTGRLHPKTLDLFLYRFDQSFGLQLSFKAGQAVLSSHVLTKAAIVMYCLLPVMIMLMYGRQLVRDRNVAMTAFLAFVIIGPVGVLFYNLVPACGPEYLLGPNFPFHPYAARDLRQMAIEPLAVTGTRNAFPSLHFAWALLIWWYSRGLSSWMRGVCFSFLVGTALVTLGLGEHYFVDLVAAFPFALAIYAACALRLGDFDTRRIFAMLAGFALTVGWAGLAIWGTDLVSGSPIIPWLLAAITAAGTVWVQRQVEPSSAGVEAVKS